MLFVPASGVFFVTSSYPKIIMETIELVSIPHHICCFQ